MLFRKALTLEEKAKILDSLLSRPEAFIAIYRDKVLYASPGALHKTGYSPEDFDKILVWDLIPDERMSQLTKEMVLKRVRGELWETKVYPHLPIRKKNGEVIYIYDIVTTVKLEDGPAILAIGIDFTEEYLKEENLRRERTNQILSHISDVISIVNQQGIIKYISPSVKSVLNMDESAFLGKELRVVSSRCLKGADIEKLEEVLKEAFENPGSIFSTTIEADLNSQKRYFEAYCHLPEKWKDVGLEGPILSLRDITEVKSFERKLLEIKYYDVTTGLPKRALVIEKMEKMLSISQREGKIAAVVVVDIKNFKKINLLIGREAGDRILHRIAQLLAKSVRKSDLVGRLEGDRFVIVLSGLQGTHQVEDALKRIERITSIQVPHKGVYLDVEVRMGVAVFPDDGMYAKELIEKAERALIMAKMQGKAYSFYSSKMQEEIERKLALKEELKKAILNRHIKPVYQPILSVKTLKPVGIEALARWIHPKKGVISPAEFVPVAEESNLIITLGYSTAEQVFKDVSKLNKKGIRLWAAVNFSPKQFFDPNLIHRLSDMAERFEVEPKQIVLEITENTTVENPEKAAQVIKSLKNLGFRVAIDDFGKGYSYLSYLVNLEVDKIKIDRDFVVKLSQENGYKVRKIVKTIVDLAHSIGALCVAEGVENQNVIEELKEMECDEVQGFYFARPMGFTHLLSFLGLDASAV